MLFDDGLCLVTAMENPIEQASRMGHRKTYASLCPFSVNYRSHLQVALTVTVFICQDKFRWTDRCTK
jgi:hypothetical protein